MGEILMLGSSKDTESCKNVPFGVRILALGCSITTNSMWQMTAILKTFLPMS